MRAGTTREGSQYLLSGAREAILAGAARDAEIALTSGMDSIEGEVRKDALLCLAQIFLELGRPDKALDIVHPFAGTSDAAGTLATLLQLRGQLDVRDGRLLPDEGARASTLLYTIATSNADASVRARAIAISGGQHYTPQAEHAARLMSLGLQIPIDSLTADEAVGLLASLAKHYYGSRDLTHCEVLLSRAIQVAESSGLRNSNYLRALNGLGVVECTKGNYEKALDFSLRLFSASEGVGNTGYAATAAGNVAMCHVRIGRYAEAMNWASRLEVPWDGPITLRLTQIEVRSLASAMMGERLQARSFATDLQAIAIREEDPWIRRRANLSAADALLLAGDRHASMDSAAKAIAIGSPIGNDTGVIGHYHRWLMILTPAASTGRTQVGLALREALQTPMDALDFVEVLGALTAHGSEYRRTFRPRSQVGQPPVGNGRPTRTLRSVWSQRMSANCPWKRTLPGRTLAPATPKEEAVIGPEGRRLHNLQAHVDRAHS